MKTFLCQCGNTLYFENSHCLVCARDVGFLPDMLELSALQPLDAEHGTALFNGRRYRRCRNYTAFDICNWMIPDSDPNAYCQSCRLSQLIPNLSEAQNLTLWQRIESAKRRLLYTLYRLRLPVISREDDPDSGLAFEFIEGRGGQDEFSNTLNEHKRVLTGHRSGVITINLKEAEHSAREEMREKMNERYRTLLGHFRHEIGHYYWDRLIRDAGRLQDFRQLFGDERLDYPMAQRNYYASGPPVNWQATWISAYASSHPWEDWAETWAHYMHMMDTLDTANNYQFSIQGSPIADPMPALRSNAQTETGSSTSFNELVTDWERLFTALNSLNRSMGLEDAYPFVITGLTLKKLSFLHNVAAQTALN